MIRKFLFSISILSAGLCYAAPLSPEAALERLNNDGEAPLTRSITPQQPLTVMKTQQGEPALYVFGKENVSGFMVVSADDMVTPLLGYSEAPFDSENIPPALDYWLNQYSQQIEYIRNNPEVGAVQTTNIKLPTWAPVSPMIKTQWNQNNPYNILCPKDGNEYSYTGCVATSMAQVMKYYNYPEKGQNRISYECGSLKNRVLTLDFSKLTFDWANMLNKYNGNYTEVEAQAVAELMMAAGYSVQMSYSANYSGAVSGLIGGALVKYFNYDRSVYYAVRDLYTYSDWAAMIYNNLKNIGPVIYDGSSVASGGHSFVCDGYQGDGYFHFNWGWGGSGDGYFLLDALNPSSIGIGGGGGGFNFDQDCILNIMKPNGAEVDEQNMMVMYGSSFGYIEGSLLYLSLTGGSKVGVTSGNSLLGWSYKGLDTMTVDIGCIVEGVDDSNGKKLYLTSTNRYTIDQTLDPMGYIPIQGNGLNISPRVRLSSLDIEKGKKYKVINAYRNVDNDNWYPIDCGVGCYNYFYITKTGDGDSAADFKIENFFPMQLNCTNLNFDTELYNSIPVEVSATLLNSNDTELTRGVMLQLYDESGKLRYTADSFSVSLAPKESLELNWTAVLTAEISTTLTKATPFYPALYDPETDTEYYRATEPVNMLPYPGIPRYSTELTLENAELRDGKYYIETSADFNVKFSVECTRNIFSYPVTLWVATLQGNLFYKELSYPLEPLVVNNQETSEVVTNISFPDAVVGNTYYIVAVVNNATDSSIPFVAQSNQAGVEELEIPDAGTPLIIYDKTLGKAFVKGVSALHSIEVYSLNGMKLAPGVDVNDNEATVDLSELGKGIVILKATDLKGKATNLKIAL